MILFLEVITIGFVLSIDSFSAAIAMGFRNHSKTDMIKFALSSGIAEGLIALIGLSFGKNIISKFDAVDHWIALFLLSAVALHMIHEGIQELKSDHIEPNNIEFHSFKKILIVSLATSLDALAVGLSLGVAKKPILPFVSSIAFFAFMATIIGLFIARKIPQKLAPTFNFIGALILILLGVSFIH